MRRSFVTAAVIAFAATFAAACTTSSTALGPNAPHEKAATDHAQRVEPIAREDATTLRARLAARRTEQLARLEAYSVAGVFPRNTTSPTPLHMLRDADGRYCAVANLVHLDGLDVALDAAAATHNDLQFADVTDGALHDWILGSGLTQDEVAAIQAPAPRMMVNAPAQLGNDKKAPPPAPKVKPTLPTEEMVAEQLRAHFRAVERQIRDATDASLALAVARLQGNDPAVAVSAR
ncbi:MAG: hypothetical protein NVS3B10_02220 [Polyangiales bacterium]